MLEELIEAVEYARISRILKDLEESRVWELRSPQKSQEDRSLDPVHLQEFLDERRMGEAAILPGPAQEPVAISEDIDPSAERWVVTYSTGVPEEQVTYVITPNTYQKVIQYDIPTTNIFYVHVPPWASIRDADELEMGQHVLGTANITTGEIRLLHSLDPAQRTEVLLHETLHLLYPMHEEKQIRNMVRDIMGKQYCHFH